MRFHIVGIGPIGTLVSYHLRRVISQEDTVTLVTRTFQQAKNAANSGNKLQVERGGVLTSTKGFNFEVFEGLASHAEAEAALALQQQLRSERVRKDDPMRNRIILETRRPIRTEFNPDDKTTLESLFITTKAHQTLGAIERLLPRIHPTTTIVLMQNGLGVYEQLVQNIFRNAAQRPHFVLASNTHGAWMKEEFHAVHSGIGAIKFGIVPDPHGRDFEVSAMDDTVPVEQRRLQLHDIEKPDFAGDSRYRTLLRTVEILQNMTDLHTNWLPMSQVQVEMRKKLVVNSVVNPLTTLMGCRNGDVLTPAAGKHIMYQVCQEAAQIFEAQYKRDTEAWLQGVPDRDDVPIGRVPEALTKSALADECLRVTRITAGNISSMLADVRRNRQTEIDFINGHLIELGRDLAIRTPANKMLLSLVKLRSAVPLDQFLT